MSLAQIRILDLVPAVAKERTSELAPISPKISAVLFPADQFGIAKSFWQHSGDGVSSRRAEYCHGLFNKGLLVDAATVEETPRFCKGPRRYQKRTSIDITSSTEPLSSGTETQDPAQFVEERYGRNLDLSMTANAKLAVRRRIAGSLTADMELPEALALEKDLENTRRVAGFSEDDVYLYPCGMSAIFNAHRNLMAAKGQLKSIVYGYGNEHLQRTILTSTGSLTLTRLKSWRSLVREVTSMVSAHQKSWMI
jgi:cystathionine gamma-synthase